MKAHLLLITLAVLGALSLNEAFLHRFSFVASRQSRRDMSMEIFEGNPFGKKVWDTMWKLPLLQPSTPGISPTSFGDAALVMKANILQLYGNETSYDGAPLAEGAVDGLLEGSLFLGLKDYYEKVVTPFFDRVI